MHARCMSVSCTPYTKVTYSRPIIRNNNDLLCFSLVAIVCCWPENNVEGLYVCKIHKEATYEYMILCVVFMVKCTA